MYAIVDQGMGIVADALVEPSLGQLRAVSQFRVWILQHVEADLCCPNTQYLSIATCVLRFFVSHSQS